ncbi:SKP1-like protein 21 isoform X2 [Tanacetum coccineum]
MMKSYIWLQTADGSIQQVEQEVAIFCPFICHEIHAGVGSSKTYPISLPARVNPVTLSLILDYCRFHQVAGRSNKAHGFALWPSCEDFPADNVSLSQHPLQATAMWGCCLCHQSPPLWTLVLDEVCPTIPNDSGVALIPLVTPRLTQTTILSALPAGSRLCFCGPRVRLPGSRLCFCGPRVRLPGRSPIPERKSFDEKFIRMDTNRLCELTSAADSLQLKPLVDLTSRALARMIEGKTPEEIRETFHIPDDLTEEEKLEPLKNITDDPRIRLLNRLYARKRKELKEKEKLKSVEVEAEHVDDRSVDDLLSFINGENGDSKEVKAPKNKKKKSRRKDQQKNAPPVCTVSDTSSPNNAIKESNGVSSVGHDDKVKGRCLPDISDPFKLQDSDDEFDDGDDIGDEIDPEIKEQIDREVEDFARRLNSDWPERVQELLSLGQDRRPSLYTVNGNGCSAKRSS